MNKGKLFAASLAAACVTLFPAIAAADVNELDVTMEVLDSVAELDGEVLEMPRPEETDDDLFDNDGEVGSTETDAESFDDSSLREDDDDFDNDDDFRADDDEEHAEDESEFDEGDDIDTDEFDEIEMEDDGMGDEEPTDE